jgi:DNA-binding transcriptional MerR regulator
LKGPEAFRSISEASDALGVPQHVLRFWETKFSFIRPMKRAGGRRFYRPQDLAVLAEVRRLLHEEGYTIKGVQKLHRELGAKRFATGEAPGHEESGQGPTEQEAPEPAPEAAPVAQARETGAAEPPLLDEAARRRLAEALEALEAAKARLDELLGRA